VFKYYLNYLTIYRHSDKKCHYDKKCHKAGDASDDISPPLSGLSGPIRPQVDRYDREC
jgi:hypothetical protein